MGEYGENTVGVAVDLAQEVLENAQIVLDNTRHNHGLVAEYAIVVDLALQSVPATTIFRDSGAGKQQYVYAGFRFI